MTIASLSVSVPLQIILQLESVQKAEYGTHQMYHIVKALSTQTWREK